MSPQAENVIERLDAARQRWWLFTLLSTAALATSASLGALFLFMLADSLARFSQPVLAAMLLAWMALTLTVAFFFIRRLLRSQRSLEATARRVGAQFPQLSSDLINVVQLAGDTRPENADFREAALHSAAARIGNWPLAEAAAGQSRWERLVRAMQTPRDLAESAALLTGLLILAAVCQLLVPNWGSAGARLMTPWQFVPSVGRVQIVDVRPQDVEVLAGSSLEVSVDVIAPQGAPGLSGFLFFRSEGEPERRLSLVPDERQQPASAGAPAARGGERQRYRATIPAVVAPMIYRVEIGDSQTELYRIGICHKPTVDDIEIVLEYPGYLGRKPDTLRQKIADIEAPQYTRAEFRIRPSVPVASGYFDVEGKKVFCRADQNGQRLIGSLALIDTVNFAIHMLNRQGYGDASPRLNRASVRADEPPAVEIVKPLAGTTAAAGDTLPVTVRAHDDHGLLRVRLEMKVESGSASDPNAETSPPIPVVQWTDLEQSSVERRDEVALNRPELAQAKSVLIRAVATDNRHIDEGWLKLTPQEATTAWQRITLVARDEQSAAALAALDATRRALLEILEKQILAHARAALVGRGSLAEGLAQSGPLRASQIDVQKASIELVKKLAQSGSTVDDSIRPVISELAFGPMIEAVKTCDAMAKAGAAGELLASAELLRGVQAQIIDRLRQLLDLAREARAAELAEAASRQTGDLPDDVKKKLEELEAALEKALAAQRKVVEASENLAKAPVEDFSQAKEQLLKDLAVAEDQWSEFMTELASDLSKLPEQDFANPSLLSELVEIQTEIKMADDALAAKTRDIAVPLEQLGAEMAEELETNLEKWLPDSPDRERWSQEEYTDDALKEAPMAELPGELEDIVGELMEEEESLFDEMEDISSSAADSLDKGAGWDAMDGPISNMSAKGVTGNRLPNSSEIGGRSGEGRQGKSSGEFVGDTAVGKGGRNTPARLTPDAFVDGQIQDLSKDPVGGATGGGKESGQGGEGLEGPSAGNRGPRQLERLAGKQAALRNKAEGIDLQHFQVSGYHHTEFEKVIESMAQVERDLRSGRYLNALRQRQVLLEGLNHAKQNLGGDFRVRQDASANLPTDVQKELLGGTPEASPLGWEELNRAYFEQLSQGSPGEN